MKNNKIKNTDFKNSQRKIAKFSAAKINLQILKHETEN